MGSCLKLEPEGSVRMVSAPSDPQQPVNGRFRIEAELASGGMGTVYAAIDTSTGARVALKRLTPGAPAQICTLFEREFYVLSSLEHPRIIRVFDYGVDEDGPFYTMELLEGSDLRELAPLEVPLACRYLRDVASSLALLHARRLLHRDVSPRNVRTLPDGGCKLIDFGALMAFGTPEDVVGTPPAIPPEALSGQPMDQRADLYSLGALAYYLLTGQHAYPARRVGQLVTVWMQRPPPPSALREGIPQELDQLVLALLSQEILGRPSNAADVIDRLTAIGGLPPDPDARTAEAYLIGTVLVERQRELERVERRIARVKTGRGASIFVDGVDGVGKSRFLAEVALKAQLAGVTVLRADAARQSGSLGVMRALVQQLVRLAPQLAQKTLGPDASAIGAVWPEVLEDLEVERTEPVGESPSTADEAGSAKAHAHAALALPSILQGCFARFAAIETAAVLVAVDNVDRADAESAALLMSFARAAGDAPLLVVTTAKAFPVTEFGAAVRALRDVSAGIRLRELSEEGVKALVRSAFGDVPHVLRTGVRLFAATDGNPEHAVSLMQGWLRSGLVRYT
ncbi:MAG TPA: serine/threonine-protein kinase, partial [Polyangiaceae bacterium]